MSVAVSYPGVYIEEFAPAAPIQGVSTSTPAFIGVAASGALRVPMLLTSWDQFQSNFGNLPVQGYFLYYAVRGFFQNQGQTCYVVRASNGEYGTLKIGTTIGALPLFTISASQPGAIAISITIEAAHALTSGNTSLYLPTGNTIAPSAIGDRQLSMALTDASKFRPGDSITVATGGESLQVVRVASSTVKTKITDAGGITAAATTITVASAAGFPASGNYTIMIDTEAMVVTAGQGTTSWTVTRGANATTAATHALGASAAFSLGTLQLASALANAYAGNSAVRLANTQPGNTVFRLSSAVALPAGALSVGTMLTIAQGTNTGTQIVSAVQTEQLGAGVVSYRVTLQQGPGFPVDMSAAATVQSEEFKLTVTQGAANQVYDNLALDGAHPRNYLTLINSDPTAVISITAQSPPPPVPMPGNMPAATGGAVPLAGGAAEDLTTIGNQDFIDALNTLQQLNDVNMISVPDCTTATVQQAVIGQCELLADRFGVLDSIPGLDPFDPAAGLPFQRAGLDSAGGYAGLYYPWLLVPPASSGDPVLVPPSGHVCGIFARSDNSRGVFKAPANEIIGGALGLERVLSNIDQGILNPTGINVSRVFQTGGAPVLYGARTTATDSNWQYVNIRRLFIFLEKSIQEGIRWAVFEPNNTQLWAKLKRSIGNFLNQQWRDGALFGDKATDAYYVRIDDALNPFSEQQLGRLHIEIGVRPSYPAEFIIVRIGIWSGGSDVSES